MTDQQNQAYIRGLLREREGYEKRGDTYHVELVNAELRRLGALAEPPAKRAAKRIRKPSESR